MEQVSDRRMSWFYRDELKIIYKNRKMVRHEEGGASRTAGYIPSRVAAKLRAAGVLLFTTGVRNNDAVAVDLQLLEEFCSHPCVQDTIPVM